MYVYIHICIHTCTYIYCIYTSAGAVVTANLASSQMIICDGHKMLTSLPPAHHVILTLTRSPLLPNALNVRDEYLYDIHVCIYIYVYICIYMHIYICIYVYIYIYIYICIYIYIYIHTHTFISCFVTVCPPRHNRLLSGRLLSASTQRAQCM